MFNRDITLSKSKNDFIKTAISVGMASGAVEIVSSGSPDLKTAASVFFGAVLSAVITGAANWKKHGKK